MSEYRARRGGPNAAVLLLSTLLAATPIGAQTTYGGQVRPRSEVRDPVDGGTQAFTSMRTRLDLTSMLAPDVRAFVQLQDVRFWGEETNTLTDFNADALDLHQAWIELGDEQDGTFVLRAGRQEVNLGGQRLVGAVGWTQQGRAFDGLRGTLRAGGLELALFGFQLAEEAAATSSVDAALLGAYGVIDLGDGRALDLYALHDRTDREEASADPRLRRTTWGARYDARSGPWSYRAEASIQRGEDDGDDVRAQMIGARIGRIFGDGDFGVTAWYDRLSGDDDPTDGEIGAFSTLYATGHKFHGLADLFTNVPAHTGHRGLQDAAVKTFYQVSSDLRLAAALHSFRVVEDQGLSTGRLAEELDLTGTWEYATGLTLTTGFSYVVQHDGFAEIGRLDEDLVWAYVMLSAIF